MESSPDTTNISELPIVSNQSTNNDEIIRNLPLSTESVQNDPNVLMHDLHEEKKVRFSEDHSIHPPEKKKVPSYTFSFKLEHKVIILSMFFFFVFSDPKFRKYILNILVQIFGNFLKTETGNLTKIGMFVYSLFYGLVLLLCVSFIDLTSFHLAF